MNYYQLAIYLTLVFFLCNILWRFYSVKFVFIVWNTPGWDFLKMALMGGGGGWKIFTINRGGARNGGIGFIMAGDVEYLVSLQSWQRGSKPPFLLRPPYIAYPPPFPNFVQPPFPHFPVTSNLHPNCSFCCSVSLAEWVITPHLMCYFT